VGQRRRGKRRTIGPRSPFAAKGKPGGLPSSNSLTATVSNSNWSATEYARFSMT
jgi:hypothetical protein